MRRGLHFCLLCFVMRLNFLIAWATFVNSYDNTVKEVKEETSSCLKDSLQTKSLSIIWERVRDAESWAPPQIYWIRICMWIRPRVNIPFEKHRCMWCISQGPGKKRSLTTGGTKREVWPGWGEHTGMQRNLWASNSCSHYNPWGWGDTKERERCLNPVCTRTVEERLPGRAVSKEETATSRDTSLKQEQNKHYPSLSFLLPPTLLLVPPIGQTQPGDKSARKPRRGGPQGPGSQDTEQRVRDSGREEPEQPASTSSWGSLPPGALSWCPTSWWLPSALVSFTCSSTSLVDTGMLAFPFIQNSKLLNFYYCPNF